MHTRAVSEVIGTLILVGVVVTGMGLVGILLLANPTPSKVPVFDSIISNRSRAIYIYHKGGDPLWAGQYKILVDGGDQTGNFTISGGTDPWSVGETLTATAPSMPRRVVIILNQSGGGASILAVQDLYPSVSVPAPSDIMWYNYPSTGKCYWQYRKSITIDGSKVAGTLSSFPVLISLSSDTGLSGSTQSTGNDILFTDSAGTTKLDHEIESYTSSTGALVAWVEVPTVTSGTNTVIYMYYGNSTVASQQNPTGVWDANYKGVWHLKENTGVADADSTGVNPGTPQNSPTQVAGQVDGSLNFNAGSSQYVQVPNSASLQLNPSMTVSGWMKTGTTDSQSRLIAAKWKTGAPEKRNYWLGKVWGWGNHYLMFQVDATERVLSPWNLADNAWHYVVGVADGGAPKLLYLYVDGVQVNNTAYTGTSETGSALLQIGKSPDDASQLWNGGLDEVRISSTQRSAQWIQTEYSNQKNPSTFSAVGTEESWWKC